MKGRPLWFIAGVFGAWVAARTGMLRPDALRSVDVARPIADAPNPRAGRVEAPTPAAQATMYAPDPRTAYAPPRLLARDAPTAHSTRRIFAASAPSARAGDDVGPVRVQAPASTDTVVYTPEVAPGIVPPFATPISLATNRLSASLWGILREGRGATPGAQLGGTQAGMRLRYAMGKARRVAITARVSTPARGTGREMALGMEWRPTALPVSLIAEQRMALDRGRGGPSLLAVAGLPPTSVAGLSLEAYGQGGAVVRAGIEPFADGAARLARGVGRFDLGIGAWGGTQRGVARVDVGPTIGLRLPTRPVVRLTLDWRLRVAGRARPDSGPALTIGSDF